ncbi:MAG: hypothetical protein Q7T33_05700 [Dehalococcoidia bacterium]|nr:hypothetical protein [Dehalococcoidia bacterium]
MITGVSSVLEWHGPDALEKTLWIVDDGVSGTVTVTGRRLDGDGVTLFQRYDGTRQNRDTLVLEGPHARRTDHIGYVVYSSPGCWQLTTRASDQTLEVTVYLFAPESDR